MLDYCTKNRNCILRDHGAATGRTIQRDRRLTHFDSTKSMEAAGAVDLNVNSKILKENNAQVGVFIGDINSFCISAIQKASDYHIFKQSDTNRAKKGVGNKLYTIRQSKFLDPDGKLTRDAISYLIKTFTTIIKKKKNKGK